MSSSLRCDLADVTSCDSGRGDREKLLQEGDLKQRIADKSLQAAWWWGEGNGEIF